MFVMGALAAQLAAAWGNNIVFVYIRHKGYAVQDDEDTQRFAAQEDKHTASCYLIAAHCGAARELAHHG